MQIHNTDITTTDQQKDYTTFKTLLYKPQQETLDTQNTLIQSPTLQNFTETSKEFYIHNEHHIAKNCTRERAILAIKSHFITVTSLLVPI